MGYRRLLVQSVLGTVTFALGLWGFLDLYRPANLAGFLECAFKTLQLLVAQFPTALSPPGSTPRPLPAQLEVARFAMPALFLWAAGSAVLRQLRQPLGLLQVGSLAEHTVLCGEGALSEALLAAAREHHHKAVLVSASVDSSAAQAGIAAGALVVSGDVGDPETWRRAGVARAATAFVAAANDSAAIAATLAAVEAIGASPRRDRPLMLTFDIENRDLRAAVYAATGASRSLDGVALRPMSTASMAARTVIQRNPLYRSVDVARGERVRALVIGFGAVGEEIALQLLRAGVVGEGGLPEITVVDPEAGHRARSLRSRYGPAAPLSSITFIDARLDADDPDAVDALLASPRAARANVIYVTVAEDTAGYLMAVALRRAQRARGRLSPPIYCLQRGSYDLTLHASAADAGDLDLTRIRGFGKVADLAGELVASAAFDRRAEAIHELYKVRAPGERPQSWDQLSDRLRQSSRDQADFLEMRLAQLGFGAVRGPAAPLKLSPAAFEAAARTEHERWSASERLMGWQPGPARDDDRLIHPSLRPFDDLSEAERDKDRAVIDGVSEVLRSEGLRPARLVAVPAGGDVKGLKASLAAAVERGEAPMVVSTLQDAAECEALLKVFRQEGAQAWLRVEVERDILDLFLRLPAGSARQGARWLIDRADQVLPRVSHRARPRGGGRSSPVKAGRGSAARYD